MLSWNEITVTAMHIVVALQALLTGMLAETRNIICNAALVLHSMHYIHVSSKLQKMETRKGATSHL